MALTDKLIQSSQPLDKGYRLTDGNGLFLFVSPTGSKVFRVRFRHNGTDTAKTIGTYPEMSLEQARNIRDSLNAQYAPSAMTLQAVCQEWLERKQADARPSYKVSMIQRLTCNVYPVLGKQRIDQILPIDILKAMRVIEARGAYVVARKTLSLLGAIFRYAVACQYIQSDPSRDLKGALQKVKKEHFAAATTRENAAKVFKAVLGYQGHASVRLGIQFLLYTVVRSGNVRHARWQDIDLENRVWNIPADQMKMNKPHTVPLSDQAMDILRQAQFIRKEGCPYIFPAVYGKSVVLSECAFLNALRAAGITKELSSPHGFRSTASTLFNEAGENPDHIERMLAHTSGNHIRDIYNRAKYSDQIRGLLQRWANMVDELASA